MNENTTETINQLKEVFAPVAAKIGVGAQYGWEVVVRQQYVEAFGSFLQFLMGVVTAYVTYRIVKYGMNELKQDDDSLWVVGIWVLGIGGALLSLVLMSGLYDAIAHVINPQFYAIEFFLDLVK